MGFSFGQNSSNQLATVDPALQAVCRRAIQISPIDFSVLEGRRSITRQHELYAQGRDAAALHKAGVFDVPANPGKPIVTWTLNSRHFPDPKTGLGNAVDLCPSPVDFNDMAKYRQIRDAMYEAANLLGTPVRWGGDWDGDGVTEKGETDFGHFELKR